MRERESARASVCVCEREGEIARTLPCALPCTPGRTCSPLLHLTPPPQVVFPLSGYAPPLRYAFYLFGIYAVFMLCLVMAEAGALGNFLM